MATAEQLYPRILRRNLGASIDGIVLPVLAVTSIYLLAVAGIESGRLKAAAAVLVILALEPFAVAFTGGSVAHHLVGIRVRRVSSNSNIGIGAASIRFLVKSITGLPAFLFVLTTKRRQALHDVVAGSVIVYRDDRLVLDHEILPELTRQEEHNVYLSVGADSWLFWYIGSAAISFGA
ncbi:RDD family protein [Methylomonas rhizoryzae]|uniref:RDD family protein n=1 Tax=Methylomonas rhizoryzae TaxID=2608981 RepID=UPI001232922D|nr:RDD family protein [Methylomonas rhizoryzae]